jgi:hypothetical protein
MTEDNNNLLESDVKLSRITDTTLEKINNLEESKNSSKKISSIQTIFSVWNTMIGSTVLTIPYSVYCAGIIPTIFIGLLYGFVCYLTSAVIVRLAGKEEDFAVIVYNYFYYGFGPKPAKIGKILQITFNLLMNTGATFIYFLIINQNLFPCICLFLKIFKIDIDATDLSPHFDRFSLFYCSLIISVILFPLTILKEMHFLSKFNSKGIYFVGVLLIFVIYQGIASLATDKFHLEYKENIEGSKDRNLFLFGENIGLLMGTLSLGLFSHSIILPIMKNSNNYMVKFLPPNTPQGIQTFKNIEKFVHKNYDYKYDTVLVGNDKIKKKVSYQNKNYSISGIGECLGNEKYNNYFGDINVYANKEILSTSSNTQSKFELGLRRYGTNKDKKFMTHSNFRRKKNKISI